jgi:hypothetical protein
MDDTSTINYIRKQIDKTFEASDMFIKADVSSKYGAHAGAFVYCGGYIQACINFGLISQTTYDELLKYCEERRSVHG